MNRITAIGLASLAAYGLLVASQYVGFVPTAREDASRPAPVLVASADGSVVLRANPEPRPSMGSANAAPRFQPVKASALALEFRSVRDLKAFADDLSARRASLTADERFHLAKALEECQFVLNLSDDLAAYSARQRKQFISTLAADDPQNARRLAAYDAIDNTQRCLRFQGAKISPRDIEDLYAAASQQGDARARARLLVAELNKANTNNQRTDPNASNRISSLDDLAQLIGLLETRDPEAMLIVGGYLSQASLASHLRIGPNGETPEPSAFLGAFSLVACDFGQDCVALSREPLNACAYAGYCSAQSFEELYQSFLASPWAYSQALRYSRMIHHAIDTRNWALIGLTPAAPKAYRAANAK